MQRPLPDLDVDLLVEHEGHTLQLVGAGKRFAAKFPTLISLVHYSRIFWSSRHRLPSEVSLKVEWRKLSVTVK